MHSKNKKNGFTLIEVLFALAILGSILTPVILNQSKLLSRIAFQSELLVRTFAGLHFMLDSFVKFEQNNSRRTATEAIDDPQANLRFGITQPREALKKAFRGLYKQQVAIEWEEGKARLQDNLVTFMFLPEIEEK